MTNENLNQIEPPKGVFVYLRVSTSQQIEGDGYARQLEKCQKFCAFKGWNILRTFVEQETGAKKYKDREQMLDMLEKCEDLGVKTVVVERVDRIARDLLVQEMFYEDCEAKGIEVYATDTEEEMVRAGKNNDTRKMMRQILGAIAEWEKEQIIYKLQHGRRKKKEKTGEPCGGPPPYGKHPDPLVRAHQQEVILFILTKRNIGERDRKGRIKILSFVDIAKRLSGKYPTPRGNQHWSSSTVFDIYENHEYSELAGKIRAEANKTTQE